MASSTPDSQQPSAAPIAFVLDDQTDASSRPIVLTLYVRPEEMTRSYPSRMAQHNTVGGAFVDSFGPGITTVSISGTHGWRRVAGSGPDGAAADGFQRFVAMFGQVFSGWHTKRQLAVQAGKDPSGVKLTLADSLNRVANVVAPTSFVLRRSKSRPLLAAYQLQLVVVERDVDQAVVEATSSDNPLSTAIASLSKSIAFLQDAADSVQNAINGTLVAPVRAFLRQTFALYAQVSKLAATVEGIPASLGSVALMSAQAGANIFRSLAVAEALPAQTRCALMQMGSAYSNVVCLLSNSLRLRASYTDYTPLYGASNCSSTSGGRGDSPLAGVNPFYLVSPSTAVDPVAAVTVDGQAALRALARADVVASPVPPLALAGLVQSINAGLGA